MAIELFGAATNYLEEATLRLRFNLSPSTAPLPFLDRYLAMSVFDLPAGHTTGWNETGTGGHEPPAASGYNRVQLHGANWTAPAIETISSTFTGLPGPWQYWYSAYNAEIQFPAPSAAWGTNEPAGFAIFDTPDPGTGNCLIYFGGTRTGGGASRPPSESGGGDDGLDPETPTFPSGQIRFGYPRNSYVYPFTTYGSTYDTHYWTDACVTEVINHVLGRVELTPQFLNLGLWGHASFGDPDTEPADTAYSRRALITSELTLTFDTSSSIANGWAVHNTNEITWSPVGTGKASQWRGRWLSLWNSGLGGLQVLNGSPNTNLGSTVADGDTIRIAAGTQLFKFF